MEISIKWNVCRICLREEPQKCGSPTNIDTMRRIIQDKKLVQQIYDCTGIVMKPNDGLPEKICQQCLTALRQAHHFRTTCQNSDEYLQSIVQKTRSATSLFQLDRHREEILELADDVVDEGNKEDPQEDTVTEKRMRTGKKQGGNQRDLARAKNAKKLADKEKGKRTDNLTVEQRKERDAQVMRDKQKKKEDAAAVSSAGKVK